MEELHKAANAYYSTAPKDVKRLADDFFETMDDDRDGRVSLDEFLAFMRQEGYTQMKNSSFFMELSKDGSGTLNFWEVMTLYYIVKSGRPFCDGCTRFIKGLFFTCLVCFECDSTTFNLCSDCFQSGKNIHKHPEFHKHPQFLDNFALLEVKRRAALKDQASLSDTKQDKSSSSNTKQGKASSSDTKQDKSSSSNTKQGKASSSNTKQDKSSSSNTKQDKASSSDTKQDKSSSSDTKQDKASCSDTKQDKASSSNTKQDKASSSDTKKDKSSSSDTKQDKASSSNTKKDKSSSSDTKQDKASSSNTKKDKSSSSDTKQDKASSSNSKQEKASSSDTKQEKASPSNTNQDKASSSDPTTQALLDFIEGRSEGSLETSLALITAPTASTSRSIVPVNKQPKNVIASSSDPTTQALKKFIKARAVFMETSDALVTTLNAGIPRPIVPFNPNRNWRYHLHSGIQAVETIISVASVAANVCTIL